MKQNIFKIDGFIYVTSDERPKENTNTFSKGINGDYYVNTIHKFVSNIGDITPYDFKIIATNNNNLPIQQLTEEEVAYCEVNEVVANEYIEFGKGMNFYDLKLPKEQDYKLKNKIE